MKNNKLKRILAIALSIAFASTVFAQAIREKTADFSINGISSKEDIGNVEVSLVATGKHKYGAKSYYLSFENYNDFTVTVTYEFSRARDSYKTGTGGLGFTYTKESGTIFLRADETKQIGDGYVAAKDIKMIVRRANPKD